MYCRASRRARRGPTGRADRTRAIRPAPRESSSVGRGERSTLVLMARGKISIADSLPTAYCFGARWRTSSNQLRTILICGNRDSPPPTRTPMTCSPSGIESTLRRVGRGPSLRKPRGKSFACPNVAVVLRRRHRDHDTVLRPALTMSFVPFRATKTHGYPLRTTCIVPVAGKGCRNT